MSPDLFEEFERILAGRDVGDRILEIGAVPTSHSLLNMKRFSSVKELIGVNLDGGESYKQGDSSQNNKYKIIKANSNDLSCFSDNYFDTVLSNSVIEHDKFFWKSLAEIRRVARKGALVVIASPGFDELQNIRKFPRNDFKKRLIQKIFSRVYRGVPTLKIHGWPHDYYRFSPQAYREVIMEGMSDVQIYSIKIPPRIFGIGYNQNVAS